MKGIITVLFICCLLAAGCSGVSTEQARYAPQPQSLAEPADNNPASPAIDRPPLSADSTSMERSEAEMPPAPTVTEQAYTPEQVPEAVAPAPEPTLPATSPKKKASQSKSPSVTVQKSQSIASKKLTLSQLRAKYPDDFKLSGTAKEKSIALTFDDGPDERFTPQVLDMLKAYGVKATFFVLGKKAEAHPAIVKRMIREGHIVGNHSYRHPLFTKLPVDQFAQEIGQTEEVLNRLIGYRPKLLRPPYGEIDEEQLLWAKNSGYVVVNWNVDSLDWKNLNEEQVSGNILGHTKAGAIVLQHSAGGGSQDLSGTVKALPGIITKLRGQGYKLVTIPELLHVSKSK